MRAQDLGGLATVRRLYETKVMEAMSSHELYRARGGDLSQTRDGGLGLRLLPHSTVRIDTA